jgi:hypothetical protein
MQIPRANSSDFFKPCEGWVSTATGEEIVVFTLAESPLVREKKKP